MKRKLDEQVISLVQEIKNKEITSPRGLKVKEKLLHTFEIDPLYPILDFPSRKFNWKYFAGELAWFLRRDTKIDFIQNFSSFWDRIANDKNEVNSNYGERLFGSQMKWVYNCLRWDKNSRQAIAFVSERKFQYEGNKDFPCTVYLNFWIRDNELHMLVRMRSNDIFFGLTYDAPFFSLVQQSMFLNLRKIYPELQLGTYHHSADNIHFYEKQGKLNFFEIAEKISTEKIVNSNKLQIKFPLFEFVPSPTENDLFDCVVSTSKYADKFSDFIEEWTTRGDKMDFQEAIEEHFFMDLDAHRN